MYLIEFRNVFNSKLLYTFAKMLNYPPLKAGMIGSHCEVYLVRDKVPS